MLQDYSPASAQTFVERVRVKDSSATHLVKTYDTRQRACWFLLQCDERQLLKLMRTTADEVIDLTQFGPIIASGWGHEPRFEQR